MTTKGLLAPSGGAIIGVDVGDRWMIATQLRGRPGRRASLRASVRLPRTQSGPLTSAEAVRLTRTIGHAGFEGWRVALVAPDAALLPAVLELPPRSSRAPIEQLARIEVARIHRREPDSFELAMWDLPASDRLKGVTHAMALAISRDACETAVAAFDGTGVSVAAVEPRACALGRCAASLSGGVPGLYGIIDVGWSGATLSIAQVTGDQPASVVYERRLGEVQYGQTVKKLEQALGVETDVAEAALRRGEEEMREARLADLHRMVRRFQTELSDALVPEAQRSIIYATQRYPSIPLAAAWLAGEGANVRGLRARLSSALALDVGTLTPGSLVDVHDESPLSRDTTLAASLGLAAHVQAAAQRRAV